jgi:hypothetical protein
MEWLKHYFWFIITSKKFIECGWIELFRKGLLSRAISHANSMTKWNKLTQEEKEAWYLSGEGRTIELE